MKHVALLLAAAILLVQDLGATPRADSLLAFTGAQRAKFVWGKLNWADDHYKGVSNPVPNLVLFDTQEGVERVLQTRTAGFGYIRISRSGKWVTYNDQAEGKTYIIDLTSATPAPKALLDKATCTYWCARAFWGDAATGTDWIYCLDNYVGSPTFAGKGIYKLPLKADGTADMGKAARITYQGGAAVDDAISVSQNALKFGGAFPWPNTMILDVATGRLDQRHFGQFGCQANLAPDNSYRFFHCQDDHGGVNMWDANLSTTWWPVDLNAGLPGFPATTRTDFSAPRWSNNVQFFCVSYPMQLGYGDPPDDSPAITTLAGRDSAFVVNLKKHWIASAVIGKFSADFKTVEKYAVISGVDTRHKDWGPDAWLDNGVTIATTGVSQPSPQGHVHDARLVNRGSTVVVNAAPNVQARVTLLDMRGRVVHTMAGVGRLSVGTQGRSGAYVVSVRTESSHTEKRMFVGR